MQRQKSIHSFVSKPSPGNENSGWSSYAEMLIRRWKMQSPTNRVKQTSAVVEVSRVSNQRQLSLVETNAAPFFISLSKMLRQKSIDSFFSKPSRGNENSGKSSYAEMIIQRLKMQSLTNRVSCEANPSCCRVNGKSDSMPFENLMQKFVVEDEPEVVGKG
ncbi:hypothetical protein AMTR_s00002p00262890 [Amborella trichopoda]|uniref:Uncharacterized protein n=1 Tax=Amborella trichopoda TaxID=13333 RepID=W1NUT4_AMBTC|nr:hypothetical protein AMTR_s00002p00262890 [Amborella trichopoda]